MKKKGPAKNTKTEKAVFGEGCFWQIEEVFREVKGVVKTVVGYMGGNEKKYPNPGYEEVCSDKTGFIEVCEIEFKPEKISYKELLELFWQSHDSTQMNRQGPDIGSQYKSVVFYFTSSQKREAEKSKREKQKNCKKKIVTEIRKAGKFYKAEEYHQQYLAKRVLKTCRF
jgi:peptide-methionine (S)-S-oxide reductase